MKRRRKQKKQAKPQLNLRVYERTQQAQELADAPGNEMYPAFFIDSIVGAYGADAAAGMLQGIADAAERPATFRANTLRSSADEVADVLTRAQIPFERPSWLADAFVVDAAHERSVWETPLVAEGKIYLQSLSSLLPPLALMPQAGKDVLDMCAAPGGKTTQMAALEPHAHITACEMSVPRAQKLEHNLAKQGAVNVQVMRCDARELDEFFSFDQILLDAPCTGSGTLVKGSERTFKGFTDALLSKCARSQRTLLDRALGAVKAGGTVVYSTCSVLPQENEDAVREALAKHRDCRIVPLDGTPVFDDEGNELPADESAVAEACRAGFLPTLPNELPGTITLAPTKDFEGFYIAKIKKGR